MNADRDLFVCQLLAQSLPQLVVDRGLLSDIIDHLVAGTREPSAKTDVDTTFPSASLNVAGDALGPTHEPWPVTVHAPVLQVCNTPNRVEIRIDDNAEVLPAPVMAIITGLGSFLACETAVVGLMALPTSIDPISAVTAHGGAAGAVPTHGGID
jgi:hypothetical protein